MSTATITGTISYPVAPGGPSASLVLGSPSTTPSSATGPQLTYVEKAGGTLYVAQADGVKTVNFQTLSDADFVYVGTDQPIDVIFDGGSDTFSLAAGGFIMMYLSSITGMTVEATSSNNATIQVLLLGD